MLGESPGVVLLGPEGVQERDDRMHERVVGQAHRVATGAPEDASALLVQGQCRLGHEPALATAGISADEDGLSHPAQDRVPHLLQDLEGRRAASECGLGRAQPAGRWRRPLPGGHRIRLRPLTRAARD